MEFFQQFLIISN